MNRMHARVGRRAARALCLTLLAASLATPGCGNENNGPPPPIRDDTAKEIASAGASIALTALLAGADVPIAETLGFEVSGIIMALIFHGGDDPSQQILDDLDQIKQTLDQIETELQTIEGQLRDLERELSISTAEIEETVLVNGLNPYINSIDSLWDQYLALHKPDGTWDDTQIASLSSAILDSTTGIFPQLVGIHNGLTAEGSVSGSTLQAVAKATALKASAPADDDDVLQYYLVLESYFGAILQAETRAATLMTEALRYRDEAALPGDFPGNAHYFMQWYQKHIEDQVEHFLDSVQYYVAKSARPNLGYDGFAPHVQDIFWRSDLTAAWLSTHHRPDPTKDADGQKMLVVRAIGGPQRLSQYPANGYRDPNWQMDYLPMLYTPDGGLDPQYDVPTYQLTPNRQYSDLQISPYVQYCTSLSSDTQSAQFWGVLSDARSIGIAKYYTGEVTDVRYMAPTFFTLTPGVPNLSGSDSTWVQWVDAAGLPPTGGEPQMLYGLAIDFQHPGMGDVGYWIWRHSHDDQSGLQSLDYSTDGSNTIAGETVSMSVNAWPKVRPYGDTPAIELSGSFYERYDAEGHYFWNGSGSPHLAAAYAAELDYNIQNNGAPADRTGGLGFWIQSGASHDSDTNEAPYDVGSGTLNVTGTGSITVTPQTEFYVAVGATHTVSWNGKVVGKDSDWHHWQTSYDITLTDLELGLD